MKLLYIYAYIFYHYDYRLCFFTTDTLSLSIVVLFIHYFGHLQLL